MTRVLRTLSFLAVLLAVTVIPADGAAPSAEGWRAVESPDLHVPWHLRDVVATSGGNAIAVGLDTLPVDQKGPAVVLRRSGGQWRPDRHYPAKSGPNVADNLFAVDALGPNNVWAVGSTDFRPIAEHWDGRKWQGIPGLVNPEAGSEFIDVTIASPSHVWAVANDQTIPALSPVAQRWDGTQWSRFTLPHPFDVFVQVLAVEALGPNDVWAVGHGRSGPTLDLLPIAWHWDGTSWSYQLMPRGGAVQVTPVDLHAV